MSVSLGCDGEGWWLGTCCVQGVSLGKYGVGWGRKSCLERSRGICYGEARVRMHTLGLSPCSSVVDGDTGGLART